MSDIRLHAETSVSMLRATSIAKHSWVYSSTTFNILRVRPEGVVNSSAPSSRGFRASHVIGSVTCSCTAFNRCSTRPNSTNIDDPPNQRKRWKETQPIDQMSARNRNYCRPPTGTGVSQEPEPVAKVSCTYRSCNVQHEPNSHNRTRTSIGRKLGTRLGTFGHPAVATKAANPMD